MLLPLIGGLVSKALPFIGKIFGGGGSGPVAPVTRALAPVVTRALPTLRRIAPIAKRGAGIAGAGAAWEAGSSFVGGRRGISVRIGRDGQEEMVSRRRRINPTNIKALRRAARRIRSFQRATRKVSRLVGLGAGGRRVVYARALPRRRRSWRGDILPFEHNGAINPYAAEDYADYMDEMEDLGYDPGSFQEEEAE